MDASQVPDDERSELSKTMEIFRKLPAFQGLSVHTIKLIAHISRRRRLSAGETVFEQGGPATQASLLVKGKVRMNVRSGEKTATVQEVKRGGFFGFMALLADFPWPLEATAVDETELITIDGRGFREILRRSPDEGLAVVERFVGMRVRRMSEHMKKLLAREQAGDAGGEPENEGGPDL